MTLLEERYPDLLRIGAHMREAYKERVEAGHNPTTEARDREVAFAEACQREGLSDGARRRLSRRIFDA